MFGPEHVRAAAETLFTEIQFAWDSQDRLALRGMIAPELLERVGAAARRDAGAGAGAIRSSSSDQPKVEYVGISARRRRTASSSGSRPSFETTSSIAADVTIRREGQFTESVRLREYWTLERRERALGPRLDRAGAEGDHALSDVVAPTAWSDEQRCGTRRCSSRPPPRTVPDGHLARRSSTSVQFSDDARAAAIDLSLADGRFAPDVLDVAARRAVAAWAEAVDGSDAELRQIADRRGGQ